MFRIIILALLFSLSLSATDQGLQTWCKNRCETYCGNKYQGGLPLIYDICYENCLFGCEPQAQ